MQQAKRSVQNPHILLAPLDWGLGHTTRCIPVIRLLLAKGCRITLAAEGASALLLRSNFPDIPILPLEGYRITYSRHASTFAARIIGQIPRILRAIRKEGRWLVAMHREHRFDLVISDNRYGLKIPDLPAVILTHQLRIRSGKGALVDDVLQKLHYPLLEKFDQCWVVDRDGKDNLAGTLSHPTQLPRNAQYVGWLSQLKIPIDDLLVPQNRILVLLSGPEPMRSLLEARILNQITPLNQYEFTFVAGNPAGRIPDGLPSHLAYFTHLNATQLSLEIAHAGLVICRSGYSTLMDLAVTGRKALLIPTPGQPEQEYLGTFLLEKGFFYCKKQAALDLVVDIPRAFQMPGISLDRNPPSYQLLETAARSALELIS
ncbi:glycosyltransferase [Larkinella harenae]